MSQDRYLIWDFDGTLAIRPGEWTATVCEVVSGRHPDLAVEPERIRPHLRSGFPWHTPERLCGRRSDDEWWDGIYPVLERAMVEGAGVEPLDARALARELRAVYTASHHWKVYEDTIPVLQALRESGWRHLMLSNHVPELSRLVADLGLHGYFTAIFCSADIGVEKPHPQAFERVFAAYPAAREGWMIGDSWTADVCGADRVGLRSILVRRAHPAATLRCETLHEVVPLLAGSR